MIKTITIELPDDCGLTDNQIQTIIRMAGWDFKIASTDSMSLQLGSGPVVLMNNQTNMVATALTTAELRSKSKG